MRTIFSIIIYPIAFTVFVIGVFTYFLVAIFISPKKLNFLANIVGRVVLLASGQWLKIEGLKPKMKDGPYILMMNHESLFDAFVLAGLLPGYMTGVEAAEHFKYPLWGWAIKRYGVIPIVREDLSQAIGSLHLAEQAIRNGTSVIILPEGTRTTSGKLRKFKKGPFHVALNTNVTILLVGVKGAYRAKKKNDWRIRPGVITARFGEPILAKEYQGMNIGQLADLVRERMIELIS